MSIVHAAPALMASLALLVGAGPAHATATESSAPMDSSNLERAVQCLALAVAYEAAFEPIEGQQAVAEVILNRTRHPAYPKSVCGVVFQGSSRRTGCQFTFTCDGAMKRKLSERVMSASHALARAVVAGELAPIVGGATHYHADYVSPYWAPSLIRITKIGAHIFYRAPSGADAPARYVARVEPAIDGLGSWATAPDALTSRTARVATAPKAVTAAPSAQSFAPWGLAPPAPAD